MDTILILLGVSFGACCATTPSPTTLSPSSESSRVTLSLLHSSTISTLPPSKPLLSEFACEVSDRKSLDSCLGQLVEHLRPSQTSGSTSGKVPCLEPLSLTPLTLQHGLGLAQVTARFSDLSLHGLSNFSTQYVRSDPQRFRFKLGLKFPWLELRGTHNMSGSLLLLPVDGCGPFWAHLTDVVAHVYSWLEVAPKSRSRRGGLRKVADGDAKKTDLDAPTSFGDLRLAHSSTTYRFGAMKVQLDNLFNGDPFLGETVNAFLNENALEFVREIRPQISYQISKAVRDTLGAAVPLLPLEHWLRAARAEERRHGEIVDVRVEDLSASREGHNIDRHTSFLRSPRVRTRTTTPSMLEAETSVLSLSRSRMSKKRKLTSRYNALKSLRKKSTHAVDSDVMMSTTPTSLCLREYLRKNSTIPRVIKKKSPRVEKLVHNDTKGGPLKKEHKAVRNVKLPSEKTDYGESHVNSYSEARKRIVKTPEREQASKRNHKRKSVDMKEFSETSRKDLKKFSQKNDISSPDQKTSQQSQDILFPDITDIISLCLGG